MSNKDENAMRNHDNTERRDGGFTLPELLIAISIAGVMVAVITSALVFLLRVTPATESTLAQSRDVSFIQSWVPADLSSAVKSSTAFDDATVAADMADTSTGPAATFPPGLAGYNVLTLVVQTPGEGRSIVAYRYVVNGDKGMILRFGISMGGAVQSTFTVADELAGVPTDWPAAYPDPRAEIPVEVTSVVQADGPTVAYNFTVQFADGGSGNTRAEFTTSGAGLIGESALEPLELEFTPSPSPAYTRCGGNVALVLDTSFSVPGFSGGELLKSAAQEFIAALPGTPINLSVIGFDAIAYPLYPDLNGTVGSYVSMLDAPAQTEPGVTKDAIYNIGELPNKDTPYPATSPDSNAYGPYQKSVGHYTGDPGSGVGAAAGNSDKIGWTQTRTMEIGTPITGGGTNWEDALRAPFVSDTGVARTDIPDTVIWITDGAPNRARSATVPVSVNQVVGAAKAKEAVNDAEALGAKVVGVLVGPGDAGLEARMADAVGPNRWQAGTDIGEADYVASSFDELAENLIKLLVSDCGGSLTLSKTMSDGSTASGVWTYDSEAGQTVIDTDKKLSTTVDFLFQPGQPSRTVTIVETAGNGTALANVTCKVAGVPLPAEDFTYPVVSDGDTLTNAFEITIEANESVSCTLESSSAP